MVEYGIVAFGFALAMSISSHFCTCSFFFVFNANTVSGEICALKLELALQFQVIKDLKETAVVMAMVPYCVVVSRTVLHPAVMIASVWDLFISSRSQL